MQRVSKIKAMQNIDLYVDYVQENNIEFKPKKVEEESDLEDFIDDSETDSSSEVDSEWEYESFEDEDEESENDELLRNMDISSSNCSYSVSSESECDEISRPFRNNSPVDNSEDSC